MNSMQLAQRVMSLVGIPGEPSTLAAGAASAIVGVINSSIAQYYVHVPAWRKATTITSLLLAPTPVTLNLTSGARAFTGFSPTSENIGDTILIGDRKCVLGVGANLREPWPYATGAQSGMHYDDAVPIFAPFRTIAGDVILDEYVRLRYISQTPVTADHLSFLPRKTGAPDFYSIETLGDAVGGMRAILRVIPAPAKQMTIRFQAILEPQLFSIKDLQIPIPVYPPDSDIEAFILPMAGAALASGVLWPEKAAREPAIQRGKDAETLLRLYHEPIGGSLRVLTPAGF